MIISRPTIIWFRKDLRLADNPALAHAVASGLPVICLYVFDDESPGVRPLGGASRWWLHRSLERLGADIATRGGRLVLRRGPAGEVVPAFARETGAAEVVWNRLYEPALIARDSAIKTALKVAGVGATSFRGAHLFEPWEVKTGAGGPYRVFTPFWRAARALALPTDTLPVPSRLPAPEGASSIPSDDLDMWRLLPTAPDWSGGLAETWSPGEAGGRARLDAFLKARLGPYPDARDIPGVEGTSRLSPHLAFGEIAPRRIVAETLARRPASDPSAEKFLSEIGWREFSAGLLYHNPELATQNLQRQFDAFPWAEDPIALRAWHKGQTGYPIVDAGMRQLWQTGWMHNRVRMIVGSFLVKHLLLDWREGEAWFWDTLVDADPGNNAAGWQWIAGCGADAAPYFRIFNPVTQGEKFDPKGTYVRRYVPELARLPDKLVHQPWTGDRKVLDFAGVSLGASYPAPIVEHGLARARALDAYAQIKAAA